MPVARKNSSAAQTGSLRGTSANSTSNKRSRRDSINDENVLFKTGGNKESNGLHGKLLNVQAAEEKEVKKTLTSKKSGLNSTSKLAGSLFTPVLFTGPRRRNTFSMPEKPQIKDAKKESDEKDKKQSTEESNEKDVQKTPKSEKKKTNDRVIPTNIHRSPVKKAELVKPEKMIVVKPSPEKVIVTPKSTIKAAPKPLVSTTVRTPKRITSFKVPEKQAPQKVDDKLTERLQELQSQFEQLSMLRSTAAEQLLDDYKKAAETRFAASQNLISSLRAENALLKERVSSLSTKSSRESNVSMLSVMSSNTTSSSSNLIFLYKNLSGLSIEPVDENKWDCSIEGRQGEYEFSLEFDADEAEYTYIPKFVEGCAVWERLPAYLKEEIVFGQNHLQAFFWRALNFLMTQ